MSFIHFWTWCILPPSLKAFPFFEDNAPRIIWTCSFCCFWCEMMDHNIIEEHLYSRCEYDRNSMWYLDVIHCCNRCTADWFQEYAKIYMTKGFKILSEYSIKSYFPVSLCLLICSSLTWHFPHYLSKKAIIMSLTCETHCKL